MSISKRNTRVYTAHVQTYFIQPFYSCGAPDDYTGDYFIMLRNEHKKNVTYNNLYYARHIHVYIISYEYLLRDNETYLNRTHDSRLLY